MLDFISFAKGYGLHISNLICDNRWHRVPTDDKPKGKDGSYKHNGRYGILINFRIMTECACHPDKDNSELSAEDRARFAKEMAVRNRLARIEREEQYKEARIKAQNLLEMTELCKHPYLAKKRFPDALALVSNGLMVIPMRDCITNELNTLQSIGEDGSKKFMHGGKARGSVFVMGRKKGQVNPIRILCEGYATGLSINEAMRSLYRPYEIVICFSASNVIHVASLIKGMRMVMADNDASGTGESAAIETGLPWVMPPDVGTDANDYHQKEGLIALQNLLRKGIALLQI